MDALFNSGFECRTEVLMDRGFQPCDRQAYTNDDFDGMAISAGTANVNRKMYDRKMTGYDSATPSGGGTRRNPEHK